MQTIFLDRDGVINEDFGYVYLWKDFQFINGSIEALQLLTKHSFNIIIVTNQSGIARGLYTEVDFEKLTNQFEAYCLDNGIKIMNTFFCPHHIDGIVTKYVKDCKNRKPNSGMFLKAAEYYNIDLKNAIMVGDKITDIVASSKSGIEKNYLINSKNQNISFDHKFNFKIKENLLAVAKELLSPINSD